MSKYELKIDLNVLNHLGLNLYSNVPAVLSELVANAWDADSQNVIITISKQEIKIEDDGCGMTADELNTKFLNVGYQRRKNINDDLTPILKRKVMGRKGIGKLSIFSIAEHIEVYTKSKNATDALGISMKVSDIQNSIEDKQTYHPKEMSADDANRIHKNAGTIIILKQLKKRVASSIDSNLKKRVARRFDIWSEQFNVSVNGAQISIEDRDYFHKLEFAAVYSNYPRENFSGVDKDNIHHRKDPFLDNGGISGWIGLVKESGGLQDGNDNLNKISVLVRGKVALEDILETYREGGLYTKFLIGEIRADFLDDTENEDITTSSRQDFVQNDARFSKLKEFIHGELKFIQKARADYKLAEGAKKAEEIPEIKQWFATLKGDARVSARKLFGRINSIATDEKDRKTLYKYGVLAFEHLRHKEKLQQLDSLNIENLQPTVQLFSELDDIEASWYYEITQGRLEVINKLIEKVEHDALEKIIQEYIYTHLWLLDPSWDKATERTHMEETVKKEFKNVQGLSDEERSGRIDIRYKKVTGAHIIIELKRSSRIIREGELSDQLSKYKRALRRVLDNNKKKGAIECICLLGKLPQGWENSEIRQEGENSLAAKNIRVVTYQQLITDAQNMYQQYLDKQEEKGRIQKLLQAIDDTPEDDA